MRCVMARLFRNCAPVRLVANPKPGCAGHASNRSMTLSDDPIANDDVIETTKGGKWIWLGVIVLLAPLYAVSVLAEVRLLQIDGAPVAAAPVGLP